MSTAAVEVNNISKRFRLGRAHDSLRDLLMASLVRVLGRDATRRDRSVFWALRDVSFAVEPGEAYGIIGPNGAGKSTMLRLLTGILRPEQGSVSVHGRLAALIEVGAGFHGDLTGRENIFLNGAILGMARDEVRGKLDQIVSFAGIERFLDMPVKRYSSGMYARLGFAIAAHVDPAVLLVDEVLSVGDAAFRLRCMERMQELVSSGTTLVFVTHNLDQMQAICRRALVLESGSSVFEGPAREAVNHYLSAVSRAYATTPTDVAGEHRTEHSTLEVIHLKFLDEANREVACIRPHEAVRVELAFQADRPVQRLIVELNMRASAHENVLSFNSGRDKLTFTVAKGINTVNLSVPRIPLAGGQYFWNVRMWDADGGETLVDTPLRFPLLIDDEGRASGSLVIDREWAFAAAPIETPTLASGSTPRCETEAHEDLLLRE